MVLDDLAPWERRGLAAAFVVAVAAAFAAGYVGSGIGTPTGAVAGDAATDDLRQQVQSMMDQQLERQRQQFAMIASQQPNISASDLSMDASVTDVSASRFGSLQAVTVSITGQVPDRTGGLRTINQEQTFYLSQDGRYLFSEPTDLQQPRQPAPGQQPPTGGQ